MKGLTVDSGVKLNWGINFSTLARNAGKYYNTKIIGIESSSPQISPIKSKTFSFIALFLYRISNKMNIFEFRRIEISEMDEF